MMRLVARVRYRRSIGYPWREALRAIWHEYPPPRSAYQPEDPKHG